MAIPGVDTVVLPLVSSIVAAIAIMLSSEIIEHNLEWKHAIVMAFAATLASIVTKEFLANIVISYVSALSFSIGGISLAVLVLNFAFWIILSLFLMSESFFMDKIKIAALGFVVSEVVVYFLPVILPMLGISLAL